MRRLATLATGAGVVVFGVVACDTISPEPDADPYVFRAPDHFPSPSYTSENNPVTEAGFRLGKALFYEANLSRDGSISCNSCHLQQVAFADNPAHPTSVGVDNQRGFRNAPALSNMAFFPEFFWDGGVHHLDFVPINAIESPIEMDRPLADVVAWLNEQEKYQQMFKEAFGIQEITGPYLLQAFSQFMVMMVSDGSRYDDYLRGTQKLTDSEAAGLRLFEQHCQSCHAGVLQTNFGYHNNGLDSEFSDLGRGRITEHSADDGKFRVPSLRNIALTAPYMHNARFQTLEDVLDHYAGGIVASATLDEAFLSDTGEVQPLNLSEIEKGQIIDFLRTLSDRKFTTNPLFRNEN